MFTVSIICEGGMKISVMTSSGSWNDIGEGGGRTDDSEVFVESVADEDAAEIDEKSELLVGDLERNERMSR